MLYRHELKFLVSDLELEKLRQRFEGILPRDAHQMGDSYLVRSLYFDDLFDSCMEEVLSGVDNRSKYRIRTYNAETGVIHLEKKSKLRGMTQKTAQELSLEQCMQYMLGQLPPGDTSLTSELFVKGISSGLRPKCIVEYDRTAYVEPAGNVRITFDRNIRGSMDPEQFLLPRLEDPLYVLPEGQHILEVKYDEFLPEYILQILDLNCLQRTSFSKYVNVRQCEDFMEAWL